MRILKIRSDLFFLVEFVKVKKVTLAFSKQVTGEEEPSVKDEVKIERAQVEEESQVTLEVRFFLSMTSVMNKRKAVYAS